MTHSYVVVNSDLGHVIYESEPMSSLQVAQRHLRDTYEIECECASDVLDSAYVDRGSKSTWHLQTQSPITHHLQGWLVEREAL